MLCGTAHVIAVDAKARLFCPLSLPRKKAQVVSPGLHSKQSSNGPSPEYFVTIGGDGTKPGLWTGLEWTGRKNGLENGRDQFAGVGVACNGSFAACLVSTVTRSRAENKLCGRVNTPGKTHHEAAVRLHML